MWLHCLHVVSRLQQIKKSFSFFCLKKRRSIKQHCLQEKQICDVLQLHTKEHYIIISRTPWSSRLHTACGVMTIRTYVFLVFVLSLHNLHKHGPFAHANVSTLGEPAGMLYPWVVWRFPVLQSTATKETSSAICIACKRKYRLQFSLNFLQSYLQQNIPQTHKHDIWITMDSDPHIYFYINVWFLLSDSSPLVHNSMLLILLTVNKAFNMPLCTRHMCTF